MASENIVISGMVENLLSPLAQPIPIDYPITSLKDFSPAKMKSRINAFSGFSNMLDSLADFLEGKMNKEEILSVIRKASLSQHEYERLLKSLGMPKEIAPFPTNIPHNDSAIASILSMVDINGNAEAFSRSSMDSLLTAFTKDSSSKVNKPACLAYLEEGNKMLDAQLAAFQSKPFFASIRASWQFLYQYAKMIGRKKDINLKILSAPKDGIDDVLELLAAEEGGPDLSPDIIAWDYPLSFTNADIGRLSLLCKAADRFKSVVVAPVSITDKLFDAIDQSEDFSPMFQDIRFLPFKKLRSTLESRAACLCAPDMKLRIANDISSVTFVSHGCWPILMRWIASVIENGDPFEIDPLKKASENTTFDSVSYSHDISESFGKDAALTAGLTFFSGNAADAKLCGAKAIIDPEIAGTAYTSLAFNLLVNRVAKLAGLRLIENSSSNDKSLIACDIESFLRNELARCRICSSPDQVTVKIDKSEKLDIYLNSDVLIGGHPAKFSFSLEI